MSTEYDLPEFARSDEETIDQLAVSKEFFFFFEQKNARKQLFEKYAYFKENRRLALNELIDVTVLLSNPFLTPKMYPVSFSYFAFRSNEYKKKHHKDAFTNTSNLKKYFTYLMESLDPSFYEINDAYKAREDFAREVFHATGRL